MFKGFQTPSCVCGSGLQACRFGSISNSTVFGGRKIIDKAYGKYHKQSFMLRNNNCLKNDTLPFFTFYANSIIPLLEDKTINRWSYFFHNLLLSLFIRQKKKVANTKLVYLLVVQTPQIFFLLRQVLADFAYFLLAFFNGLNMILPLFNVHAI